jgi:hypothetical protein
LEDEEIPGERGSYCQRYKQETAMARASEPGEVSTAAEEKYHSEQCVDREQGILPERACPDPRLCCNGQFRPRSPDLKFHILYP